VYVLFWYPFVTLVPILIVTSIYLLFWYRPSLEVEIIGVELSDWY